MLPGSWNQLSQHKGVAMPVPKHLRLGATVYHVDYGPAYGKGTIKYVRKPRAKNQHGQRTNKRFLVEWSERVSKWDMSFHTQQELTPTPPAKVPFRPRK